jgi:hypothetical protein
VYPELKLSMIKSRNMGMYVMIMLIWILKIAQEDLDCIFSAQGRD